MKSKTDVLVVGGGPVGLFSALCLTERGLNVRVVDCQYQGAVHSRALALHPESLRLLDEQGVSSRLLSQGHRIDRVAYYQGDKRQVEVDIGALGGTFPFVLVVSQSLLETALEQVLRERGVRVQRNHQVERLETRDASVLAEVAQMEKASVGYSVMRTEWEVEKVFQIEVPFVIGADGRDSGVRSTVAANETFGPTDRFLVFEFAAPLDVQHEVRVVLTEESSNVLWPLAPERGRWTFQRGETLPERSDEELFWSFAEVRAPWFRASPLEIEWSAKVHFDRRLVSSMGRWRSWLVGDAAHSTSPIGVQSMNIGFREAHDLAERVSAIVHGGARIDVLDAYDEKWRTYWRELLKGAVRFAPGAATWVEAHGSRMLSSLPASGKDLESLLAQLGMSLG